MATKYIQVGDTLVERARVAGARYVPADSPAAVEKSQDCVRLRLRRPDEVISVHAITPDTLEGLWGRVTDLLNGVEPAAAPAAAADPEPALPPADDDPAVSDETAVADDPEAELAADAAEAEALAP